MRRVAVWLFVGALVAGLVVMSGHPIRLTRAVDSTSAFVWDTSGYVVTRGACGPTTADTPTRPDWRPEAGRFLLTMALADTGLRAPRLRGRLWLAEPPETPAAAGRDGAATARERRVLYGATDLDLASLLGAGAPERLAPAPRSTDPRAPGIVVTRDPASRRYQMLVGSDTTGLVFEIRQGVGDGFAGDWRSRDAASRAHGYFCAGWIDV